MDFLERVRNLLQGNGPSGVTPAPASASVAPPAATSVAPSLFKLSRAWQQMNSYWVEGDSISVLDLGCTSSSNFDFFLNAGYRLRHDDILRGLGGRDGSASGSADGSVDGSADGSGNVAIDPQQYLAENLLLPAASLDAILLWDVLDYVPQELIQPLAERLSAALRPGGTMLALFHPREAGPAPMHYQYHIQNREILEWRPREPRPLQQFFQVRHVENLFSAFQSIHFFLGYDGMREVLMVR